ncbi:hypothetical protein M2284_001507 [Rhodococcus sp. LBL1]|jgi:hypothetical protein|uniref:Uncharacterized protein n=1 Tax=Prescottella agglutinans TaxID=1644129 RepID=A0ABT6MHY0_9NOCA|nr:hypothetical protein [Prescottella agglutinans]MDH6283920.1 hypothetical protein [Prescottella agglutinans]MDH6677309.1 hypothetical protein [Rhodococcus sp. LBL1]MDH6682397.1 hypothetical protein [Rhodococcus sp. LBL2]
MTDALGELLAAGSLCSRLVVSIEEQVRQNTAAVCRQHPRPGGGRGECGVDVDGVIFDLGIRVHGGGDLLSLRLIGLGPHPVLVNGWSIEGAGSEPAA